MIGAVRWEMFWRSPFCAVGRPGGQVENHLGHRGKARSEGWRTRGGLCYSGSLGFEFGKHDERPLSDSCKNHRKTGMPAERISARDARQELVAPTLVAVKDAENRLAVKGDFFEREL